MRPNVVAVLLMVALLGSSLPVNATVVQNDHSNRRAEAVGLYITALYNSSWTSAILEATLCPAIATAGPSGVTSVQISAQEGPNGLSLPSQPMLVPDCFWTLDALELVSMSSVKMTGNSQADPLVRLPGTLKTITLNNVVFSSTAQGSSFAVNWSSFFTSKPNLSKLFIENTNIAGSFMASLPEKLLSITITGNKQLGGSIAPTLLSNYPASVSDLQLDFTGNSIAGALPTALFSNYKGKCLSLSFAQNVLSGPIPSAFFSSISFPSCAFCALDFSGNQLAGALPSSLFGSNFWNVQTYVSLYLENNQLSGTIPSSLLPSSAGTMSAVILSLNGNALNGPIPNFYAGISSSLVINTLSLSFGNNMLSGALPSTMLPPASMDVYSVILNFVNNTLSGVLPSTLLQGSSTGISSIFIGLSGNALSGTIDPAMVSTAPFTALNSLTLLLDDNSLSGPLTADFIGSARGLTGFFVLSLSGNPLGGEIPQDLFSAYANKSAIKTTTLSVSVSNCNLTGTLPPITAALYSLTSSIAGNDLEELAAPSWSAYLGSALENITSNLYIDIANNKFAGDLSLPDLMRATSLRLYARNNLFSSLTLEGRFGYLASLDIGLNTQLNGTLPKSLFTSGSKVGTLLADGCSLSGDFPDLSGLSNLFLTRLDLSNTTINFCPSTWTSPWTSNMPECNLNDTNANECINFYPKACRTETSPSSSPSNSPSTGGEPSIVPSAPTGPAVPSSPSAPSAPALAADPTAPAPSAASSWSSSLVLAIVLLIALAGFY